jgi:hypothetical protein
MTADPCSNTEALGSKWRAEVIRGFDGQGGQHSQK